VTEKHLSRVVVMFKNMTRQAFGKVQAKLFPKYFLMSVLTLALQIGTLKFAMPVGLQREQLTSLGTLPPPPFV
jgi:hypothetical protein